ncbi:MarR family winged helix-turn-helix transcriptional regulator [Rhodococcus sp. IEGM 1330]|uniref:MarR family winged helix-turn-helix transcriptional regulator n=1 Tax=Rhodococcus sp. IEGM 1330 TaxID=3082225 RepID=UPI00295364D0|nr:MarR family transcriptional regulator [Rhodococcus sp. IEGM 1330]MDV8025333.1 MarR family transcriptional regulator [Rhodococcus sp. IEGM 1330]
MHADELGLTLSTCEANFYNLLLLHGPLSPGLLGQLTDVASSGTTTGVIDRLEKAGYVERARSTEDRRKVIVSLNPDRADPHDVERTGRLWKVLDHFDETQLAVIADFLSKLAKVESQAATPPDFPYAQSD